MSALTKARAIRREKWNYKSFTLASGKKAWRGGLACYDESAGAVIPAETGSGQTDLFMLGLFEEDVDASGGALPVVVKLKKEVEVVWFANDGTNPVTVNDIGKSVYAVDDQTVSDSSATSTRSAVGIAWAVDSTLGVAVEIV